jgi:hypothetical protein
MTTLSGWLLVSKNALFIIRVESAALAEGTVIKPIEFSKIAAIIIASVIFTNRFDNLTFLFSILLDRKCFRWFSLDDLLRSWFDIGHHFLE